MKLADIKDNEWREALSKNTFDPDVGIKHAVIKKVNDDYTIHVAEIKDKVSNHYHQRGLEHYFIVQGKGVLHTGQVTEDNEIEWIKPQTVIEGDHFIIKEGFAHQLENSLGGKNLIILFGCPDSHLNNDEDRFFLPDSPDIKKK